MTYLQAVALGLIQGLTEFLPVSSSGHLALAQTLWELKPDSSAMLWFDVCSHLGTLIAVGVVFAGTFGRFAVRLWRESSSRFAGKRVAWRIVALTVAASIPTAVIGLVFKDDLQAAFGKPTWIGVGLLVTGGLLWSTNRAARPRRGWGRFAWWRAALVGIAQGVAILPGISRSGSTICCAMLLGLKRRWAAQFSFLIAVPAIVGATVLEFADLRSLPADSVGRVGPVLLGSAVAMLSGYAALRILLGVVQRAKLHLFAYYCWAIGAVVILWMR